MTFCPNCGIQLSDKSNFCMKCGVRLADYVITPSQTPSYTQTTTPPPAPEVEKTKPKLIKCLKCGGTIEVTSTERPIDITCPHCGVSGTLK